MFSLIRPRQCVENVIGSAILAFGLYQVHSFAGVTEGGVLGLTLLLHHWLHLSPAVSGLVLNIACYPLCWGRCLSALALACVYAPEARPAATMRWP